MDALSKHAMISPGKWAILVMNRILIAVRVTRNPFQRSITPFHADRARWHRGVVERVRRRGEGGSRKSVVGGRRPKTNVQSLRAKGPQPFSSCTEVTCRVGAPQCPEARRHRTATPPHQASVSWRRSREAAGLCGAPTFFAALRRFHDDVPDGYSCFEVAWISRAKPRQPSAEVRRAVACRLSPVPWPPHVLSGAKPPGGGNASPRHILTACAPGGRAPPPDCRLPTAV